MGESVAPHCPQKNRCCPAYLTRCEMFRLQVRSSDTCTARNMRPATHSTSSPLSHSPVSCLKLMVISFWVFCVKVQLLSLSSFSISNYSFPFIFFHGDCCYSLHTRLSQGALNCSHLIQTAAARLLTRKNKPSVPHYPVPLPLC